MNFKFKFLVVFFIFITSNRIISQNLYGGIEIGSKGVKISVIDVQNIKKSRYEVKDFWTENIGIAKGISKDGNLTEADMNNACEAVLKNYKKLLNQYKIENNNIYVVASSGVGMAKNTAVLIEKIKTLTTKNLEIISAKAEAKLMFKGCIPPKYYQDGLLIDIGGGNTKGGFVSTVNDEDFVFSPLSLDIGTITLTEKINKNITNDNLNEFTNQLDAYEPKLKSDIDDMYKKRALSTTPKKNIYTSGGCVWSFYTLFTEKEAPENFNPYTLEDLKAYDKILRNNFEKFEEMAKTNKQSELVLKTYSQKYLIAANKILITTLSEIDDIENKKIFFVKQGQIAWLLSYIADSARNIKTIY